MTHNFVYNFFCSRITPVDERAAKRLCKIAWGTTILKNIPYHHIKDSKTQPFTEKSNDNDETGGHLQELQGSISIWNHNFHSGVAAFGEWINLSNTLELKLSARVLLRRRKSLRLRPAAVDPAKRSNQNSDPFRRGEDETCGNVSLKNLSAICSVGVEGVVESSDLLRYVLTNFARTIRCRAR